MRRLAPFAVALAACAQPAAATFDAPIPEHQLVIDVGAVAPASARIWVVGRAEACVVPVHDGDCALLFADDGAQTIVSEPGQGQPPFSYVCTDLTHGTRGCTIAVDRDTTVRIDYAVQ